MIKILESNDREWNEILSLFPVELRDIYYTADYNKLYELNDISKAIAFVYKEEKKIAFYPFLLNKINDYGLEKEYFDIETVYGYGGPITNNNNKEFLKNFENSFVEFCKDNKIVAEFIRFHPLLKNENLFSNNVEILHNRIVIPLNLDKGTKFIWEKEFNKENRNKIRKAEKNGLKVIVSRDFVKFKEIYEETMNKVYAGKFYYFSDDYYNMMCMNNKFILLNVLTDEKIIASAIFMKYNNYFHYHLSGSLKEYLGLAPNNYLLWEAIKIACENGAKIFHFGGGLTDNSEDNLLKFKRNFSKCTADFYIGKRIHNKEIYDYLISKWEKTNNKKSELFLQYRY